jgi:hypothetical protein
MAADAGDGQHWTPPSLLLQMSVRQEMFRAGGPVSSYVARTQPLSSASAQVGATIRSGAHRLRTHARPGWHEPPGSASGALEPPERRLARSQASIHDRLQEAGFFTPEEQDLLRWASNSNSIKPPQRSSALEYKKASSMEALVGAAAGRRPAVPARGLAPGSSACGVQVALPMRPAELAARAAAEQRRNGPPAPPQAAHMYLTDPERLAQLMGAALQSSKS